MSATQPSQDKQAGIGCGPLAKYPILSVVGFAVVGIALGIGLGAWEPDNADVKMNVLKWIGLLGDLFIRALKAVILPLVFVNVAVSVVDMMLGDTSAGSHSARHSVEDQDDERDPPPVPSYRKDHPHDPPPAAAVAPKPQSSSPQQRQDRRSKSAPRPSRAAVQEWLSSGSRDVAELERSPRAHHRSMVSKSSTSTTTTTNGSGSDNKIVYAHSLLERSKSNGNLAQGIRQGGVLASRAAERIKQSRQQQQKQQLPKQTTPMAPSPTTRTTTTKTPAKITFTMKVKPPSRSAGKATTTTATTTRPSTANGTSPSSFFALKPTGLVATPPSSTSRRFDFDKYDEYDDIDDDDDSEDDEDPTIYSRADWYD